MSKRHFFIFFFIAVVILAATSIPITSLEPDSNGDDQEVLIAGRNVNMVSGITLPNGDPWLQRQNEPSIAVSTRNPLHLLAGANDYRTVDMPIEGEELPGQTAAAPDAWVGVFKSFDGGESWISTLLPGFLQDSSAEGMASPLKYSEELGKGFCAAADPVVRAGTNGLFYYSGIAFNRTKIPGQINSAVFLARFIDNNNVEGGDSIKYIDTQIIANDGMLDRIFVDKPWIAVDAPNNYANPVTIDGQQIPRANVYIAYSVFSTTENSFTSEIIFRRSTDCGETWEDPIVLSAGHELNQAAVIAVDARGNSHVYAAWRRFNTENQTSAIIAARSANAGESFHKVTEVACFDPFPYGSFDQPSTPDEILYPNPDDLIPGTSFRTNSYPTMTVDEKGTVYLAWAQRGWGPSGEARILLTTTRPGFHFEPPTPIPTPYAVQGHEFMPSLTYAGGKLTMVWYDQRDSYCGQMYGFGDWISDYLLYRHTIDVWAAQADTSDFPNLNWIFTQVSRYLFHTEEDPENPGTYKAYQAQFNPPNYPLFKSGTLPFHGDYLDITPSPMFVLDGNGHWRFNTEPADNPLFHVSWTDNRDVSPPDDGDWTSYGPPTSEQLDIYISDGRPPCEGGQKPGMRNQNVYTSRITTGIEVGSPTNTKLLNLEVPRAFVIFVKNNTGFLKSFRLTIANQPPGGQASFLQFDLLEILDVSIAPYSTISRQVFVDSTDLYASVGINIDEIDEPGGGILPEGDTGFILLNGDPTSPGITGEEETHQPEIDNPNIVNWIVNPNIVNPNIVNPNIVNPNIVNPNIVNPNIVNPNIVNPNIVNPNIVNPNIVNPNIVNPNIVNPNIVNAAPGEAAITDVEWPVRNAGNTASSFTFKIIAKEALPEGIYAQLIVYKVHYSPAIAGSGLNNNMDINDCELKQAPNHEVLLSVVNPNIVNPNIVNPNIVNPNIVNAAIENATFVLGPGEEAIVNLRILETSEAITTRGLSSQFWQLPELEDFIQSLAGAVTSQSVDSDDAEQGIEEPEAAATALLISTSSLPPGLIDESYPPAPHLPYEAQLTAVGGTEPYSWWIDPNDLPPGLSLDRVTGQIFGTPLRDAGKTYPYTYYFTAQVTDSSSPQQSDNQTFSITIEDPYEPPPPLMITTPSPLPVGSERRLYGVTLEASGGVWPYTWTLQSGSLPAGLSLDSGGFISGMPESGTAGTHSFRIRVTDSGDPLQMDERDYTLTINESTAPTYTISGTVTIGDGGPPLQGVLIRGLPGAPTTDESGFYSDTVPEDWSGTATPFKAGYYFDPPEINYSQVNSDQLNQDYDAYSVELDHFEFNAIGEQIAGISFTITITAKDSNGNTVETYNDTNALSDSTGTISPTSTSSFLNGVWIGDVFITMASAGVTITTSGGGKTGGSNAFNVVVGAAANLRIEDADDGTGAEVDTITITPGASFTVYSILRDSFDNFIENTSVTWELIDQTGEVGGGDLVPAGDEKSATFTGSGEGTAKIAAYYPSLYDETGIITVTSTPPDDSYEDNDDFNSAADITTGTYSNLQLLDDDWYKIYVEENMDLKVTLAGVLGNNIDLGLADSSGKYLVGGLSASSEDTIYFSATEAGDYYIRIPYTWGEGLQNTYTLTAEISDGFGQGQVFGRVTNSTNDPLQVRVRVFDRYGYRRWNTLTDAATGDYRISVPEGSYKIRFITYPILDYYGGINYLPKFYDNKPRFAEAPLIEVLAGETVFDIDGQLDPAGTISGTVTDLQGNSIEGAFIRLRDLNGDSIDSAYSDEFGQYTIERLNTGYYKAYVRSGTENHGIEWYNDKPSFNEANAVYVETGQTTSGIDFQLTDGGNVEGRVTDINGGVGNVQVVAYDPSQIIPYLYPSAQIPQIGLRSTRTDENGYYFMGHLPNGNISLYFNPDNTNHVAEFYDDALKFEDAAPVRIYAGQTTSDINVELAESGSIGGRVTNSSGDGLRDVLAWAFHLEGGGYYQKYAYTNEDGYYRIDRIPVDNVKVRFRPNQYTSPYTGNWAVEWYDDKTSYTTADELTVVVNETTWGFDAVLADNGGTIEGRIINSIGQGIGGVYVSAYDSSIQAQVSFVYSDEDGYYSIPRIPTCDVKLAFFTGYNKLPYASEFYSDQSSYADATPVSVVLGETTFLPDVVLSDRPDLAVLTDTLPDGEVGTPYSQALVAVGGTKPYHWSLDLASLPDGLYLTSSGVIEGTPTAEGTFDFTVKVVDSSFPPQESFSQNLSITINSYEGSDIIISGNVTYEGSPFGRVLMAGLPDSVSTNASGAYIALVPSGWSGEVTPALPGYAFSPLFRSYDDVMANQINQDYSASVGLTISGTVWFDGSGLPGVLISGLPGNPTTDGNGNYAGTIPVGWSGTVTPSKTGYTFNPSNRSYNSVASGQFGQDYDATFLVGEEWVARYDGPAANSIDDSHAVATDSSGNIYVTGSSTGGSTSLDILTIKYNSAGEQLWEARYNGPGNSSDYGAAIAVDSAGNVYVTGYGGWSQSVDYLTIKYDSNGNKAWAVSYNGPENSYDYSTAIAVDSAGNVYVTGQSHMPSEGYYDFATVKYNSDGEEQWAATYGGEGNRQDTPEDIAVDSAGNVYVTGGIYGDSTGYDYATIKYDSSTGDQDWVAIYDSGHSDRAYAMAVDGAGNVYVTGQSYRSGTSYDFATIKYDTNGTQVWIAWYDNDTSTEYAHAIALDPSGNVCVSGYSLVYTEEGSNYDYATVVYDNDGVEQWAATYNGPENGNDRAYALDVDSAGNVYVTGWSIGSNMFNEYATVKYDITGSQVWARRYDGSANGHDFANDIVVDAFGDIVVTGSSHGSSTNDDYATIKYDGSGNLLWNTEGDGAVRYNGPTNDDSMYWAYGEIMELDSSNNVYISGYSYGNGTAIDYTTVKFDSSGNQEWARQYNGPGNYIDYARNMTVDPSGNVYVTGYTHIDAINRDFATVKYNSAGDELWAATYDGPANGYDSANAIAVDASGNVYVTGESQGIDTSYDCTTIKYNGVTGDQEWVARYNNPFNATDEGWGIAVDTSGNVYVTGRTYTSQTTRYDFLTIKYDSEGVQQWVNTYNGADNSYDYAYFIALDSSNNVYVCGEILDDYCIVKYNSAGNFIYVARYAGPANGNEIPLCLAVDSAGNAYVTGMSDGADMSRDLAVVKFDSNGAPIWIRRYEGESPGSYDYGNDIAFDSSGNVYVSGRSGGTNTSYDGDCITMKYDSDGNLLWMMKYNGPGNGVDAGHALSVTSSGDVYVGGMGLGSGTGMDFFVVKYSQVPTTDQTYEYVSQWGSYGTGDGEFDYPLGAAVDSSGYIYVIDNENARIQKFTSDGTYVTQWGSYGSGNGEFINPHFIAVDSSNNVYVTDTGNDRVQKFTADGTYVTQWGSYGTGDGEFDYPQGIAVDSSGYVYVADNENARIQKFTADGTYVTQWGSYGTGNDQFLFPSGMAVDSADYVYVADANNHRVQKFTADGIFVTKWGSQGAGDGEFDYPLDIAVDSAGYVYVVEDENARAQKFTSNGIFVTKWGNSGSGDGEFLFPSGIAVDSAGYVYVVDSNNNRVQKFK